MLLAHEQHAGIKYDVIVCTRLDVLFTHIVPARYYRQVAEAYAKTRPVRFVYSPSWGTWQGLNDRFMLGQRDAVLFVLNRLHYVEPWASQHKVALHSETFLRDTVAMARKSVGNVSSQMTHEFRFRRVRSDNSFAKAEYDNSDESCEMDMWKHCRWSRVARTPSCDS
jgi:hypothetical protein